MAETFLGAFDGGADLVGIGDVLGMGAEGLSHGGVLAGDVPGAVVDDDGDDAELLAGRSLEVGAGHADGFQALDTGFRR